MADCASTQPWIDIRNVSFRYPDQVVFNNIDMLAANRHRIISIVGASGVGKSTLLSLLAGFIQAQSGVIKVCQQEVKSPSSARPVVFQDNNLFPWKTVAQNIEFGLKAMGDPKSSRIRKSRNLMQQLGLLDKSDVYPKELSGGMQQRVGLARCLAVQPECILMDEPFSAIDYRTKDRVIQHFLQHLGEFQSRAVLVTHDLVEAVTMASCVFAIKDDKTINMIEFSTPESTCEADKSEAVTPKVDRVKQALLDEG
jgi:NitT/TauT family transport system ATP-binding protein